MNVKTFIKINDILYPATIGGKMSDRDWDDRATKSINLEITYDEAVALFKDDLEWDIVQETTEEVEVFDEETQQSAIEYITSTETFDNSDYCILGDITLHKNGTITVKMGQPTAEELLEVILGGIR